MLVNPIVLGVCCTIGAESFLIVLVLAVKAVRYFKSSGKDMMSLIKK